MTMTSTPAITIFTVESEDLIRRNGGSGYWRIDPRRAKGYSYVVVTQNRWRAIAERETWDFATGDNEHGSAFLVAKLVDVVPADEPGAEGRHRLIFNQVARLTPPLQNVWDGSRMPVNYGRSLEEIGVDPGTLVWEPITQTSGPQPNGDAADAGQVSQTGTPSKPVTGASSALDAVTLFAARKLGVGLDEIEVQITLRPRPREERPEI